MSIHNKLLVGVVSAGFVLASATAGAKDHSPNGYYGSNYEEPYEDGEGIYDYAKVVDVQPLTTRVRVQTPRRECWDETRYEQPRYDGTPRSVAGRTLLGAVLGGVIGHQIGSGNANKAATAGGAVIGAAVAHNRAMRDAANPPAAREYTVQRCETRYTEEVQERIDAYRVTYMYHGRRQVTELPYRPGDRIRVRVDVTPAE
jgi:uncharacterized protein YcfJ